MSASMGSDLELTEKLLKIFDRQADTALKEAQLRYQRANPLWGSHAEIGDRVKASAKPTRRDFVAQRLMANLKERPDHATRHLLYARPHRTSRQRILAIVDTVYLQAARKLSDAKPNREAMDAPV